MNQNGIGWHGHAEWHGVIVLIFCQAWLKIVGLMFVFKNVFEVALGHMGVGFSLR